MRPRDHAVDILANMGEKERESARSRLSAMQGGTWPPPDPSGRNSPKTFVNHQVIVQDDCASDCWMGALRLQRSEVNQLTGVSVSRKSEPQGTQAQLRWGGWSARVRG